MKTNPIFLSDIQKLVFLFTQKNVTPFIFDPFDRMIVDTTQEPEQIEDDLLVLVNLAGRLDQYKGYRLEEFDLVLDFGDAQVTEPINKKTYYTLNHPNGHLRWLYKSNRLSGVLAFYNDSGYRGRLISRGIRLLSALKLGKFISKESINVYHKAVCPIDSMLGNEEVVDSIFMGTPGVQQTALLSIRQHEVTTKMLKIPFGKPATLLLQNEKAALVEMGTKSYQYMKLPKIGLLFNQKALLLENLKSDSTKHTEKFTHLHASAIGEMHHKKLRFPLMQCGFWQAIQNTLNGEKSEKSELLRLQQLLGDLNAQFNPSDEVAIANSHGDFTPWNLLSDGKRLSIYDWELWSSQAPALYDLFHFHYQRGILMNGEGFKEIQGHISNALQMEPIGRMIKEMNLNVEQLHRLYLLRVASYFLQVFNQQKLTLQNEWQIKCWEDSISFELAKINSKLVGSRISLIKAFNQELQAIPHAYLKFDYDNLESLPIHSDLDIALKQSDVSKMIGYLNQHPLVDRLNMHKKSFMTNLELFLIDGEYLSIDLIHRFQRKGLTMLSAKELLEASVNSPKGIRVPALQHDLAYTFLFYTLNNASIPIRYYQLFDQHSNEAKQQAIQALNERFGLSFTKLSSFFTDASDLKSMLINQLRSGWKNSFVGHFNYLIDVTKEFLKPKGFMITFSGVDGAGKSTILKLVEEKLIKQYRKEVVLLRHRPGILPILSAFKHGKVKAEQIASETIPRKGKNKGKWSSMLRFAYYYTDYLIGQLYVYFRYISRGKIVLYDRYYFDFINDARRSNINIDRGLAKKLYGLILKPKLNIFLYADPQTILSRKQELEEQDIIELSKNYFNLFEELSSKSNYSRYTSIKNLDLKETLNQILREFVQVA